MTQDTQAVLFSDGDVLKMAMDDWRHRTPFDATHIALTRMRNTYEAERTTLHATIAAQAQRITELEAQVRDAAGLIINAYMQGYVEADGDIGSDAEGEE